MNYKTDTRIASIQPTVPKDVVDKISKKKWFKVVRRENTPLWESLIQAGGALSAPELGFINPMQDLYALDYDKYAAQDSFDQLKSQFIEVCKKHPTFLSEFFVHLENECKKMDSLVHEHINTDWKQASNQELGTVYDLFVNYSLRILTFLWPPLGPESWLVEQISQEIAKHIDVVNDFDAHQSALHLIVGSKALSAMQEREEAILKLAISKKKQDIEPTFRKFAWITDHSLKFEYETLNQFETVVNEAMQNDPERTMNKILSERKKADVERDDLLRKFSMPEHIMQYIHQVTCLPHWRLLRTEKSIEAAYYMREMFLEIQKRMGVPNILLSYYWEVGNFLEGKPIDKQRISDRNNGYGLMITADVIYDLDTENRSLLKKTIEATIALGNVIKGSVACKGFVTAKVRVLENTGQLSTFKQGEVLVTSMTTPEFVPIMKKAAAIVTDEGGISCHAAIVSRELKIPCVIGTKNATRILKTGDVVEVDANNGTVKKI